MLREVRVENGVVRGLPAADPRITSFKGIPFAAPPVGENRWRAPQPAHDWDGVLEAYTWA
ncbi:MAG: carboxylesterase family protein, partial [Limnochordia bacterium]